LLPSPFGRILFFSFLSSFLSSSFSFQTPISTVHSIRDH
jgi:hypothetical protein